MTDLDACIERLRQRLADPDRRVDVQPRAFDRGVAAMGLGELLASGTSMAAQLRRVVDANQAGRPIDPDLATTVEALGAAMATPAPPALRAPASAAMLTTAESSLGMSLPIAVRRIYGEVADGGFGPGTGLLPLADAVAAYHAARVEPPMAPDGQRWPVGLVPLLRYDLGMDAVEVGSGRMIAWDPEELTERSGARAWLRTFSEIAPSFEAWLDAWALARSPAEVEAERMHAATLEHARASRAYIAALSPEERAAMGLPEVGWESVVWGGIGLDADDDQ